MSQHNIFDTLLNLTVNISIYLDTQANMCYSQRQNTNIDAQCIRNADDSLFHKVYNAFDIQHHRCSTTSATNRILVASEKR